MRRVAVIGNSGSGKTTLARALPLPHVELDALFHRPGWVQAAEEDFRAAVAYALPVDGRWVADGNYRTVRDIVWGRADTLVWLDLPRPVVTGRIVRRTIARAALRTELWNGNRERWKNLTSLNPQESVIAWSVQQHAAYRREYAAVPADPRWQHLRFVRLRSPAAVAEFVRACAPAPGTGSRPRCG